MRRRLWQLGVVLAAGMGCALLMGGCPFNPGISATEFEGLLRTTGTQAAGALIANALVGPFRALVDAVGVVLTNLLGTPVA